MSDSWPELEAIVILYQHLCAGDRLAQSAFIAAILDPLASHLRLWRRDADEHTCLTAAEDAVLSLIRTPAIYDPAKRGLIGFLCMAAEGDLLNALKKEKKHCTNRENRDCVELPATGGNSVAEELADDLPSFDDPDIAAEIASFTATEREVLRLMRDGEKRTSAFAAVLGIEHLPVEDQAREAKRAKGRIIKRLQRARRKT
jgi:DNA-directed RNA polymerase specialized sigma24 family protein